MKDEKRLSIVMFIIMLGLFSVYMLYSGKIIVYADSVAGYVWHSILALLLTGIIFWLSGIRIPFEKKVFYPFMAISRNEYGIYGIY